MELSPSHSFLPPHLAQYFHLFFELPDQFFGIVEQGLDGGFVLQAESPSVQKYLSCFPSSSSETCRPSTKFPESLAHVWKSHLDSILSPESWKSFYHNVLPEGQAFRINLKPIATSTYPPCQFLFNGIITPRFSDLEQAQLEITRLQSIIKHIPIGIFGVLNNYEDPEKMDFSIVNDEGLRITNCESEMRSIVPQKNSFPLMIWISGTNGEKRLN